MNNLGGTLILLLLALLLLYLAVTDRLSRILDAKDVITGVKTVVDPATSSAATTTAKVGPVALSLPSLPSLGINAQVSA